MKVKGKTYDYRVTPTIWGNALVEVFQLKEIEVLGVTDTIEILLIKKEFGGLIRGIKPIDYQRAKAWGEEQLESIYHANKEILD